MRDQLRAIFFSWLVFVSMIGSGVVIPGTATAQTGVSFEVSNASDRTVNNGSAIDLSATVENVGNESGTRTVGLSIAGTDAKQTELNLSAGERDTITFQSVTTADLGPGEYTYTIESASDSANGTLRVQPRGSDGDTPNATVDFRVSNVTHRTVTNGTLTDLSAAINNAGNTAGTQTVTLSIDGSVSDQTSLTLSGGENSTVRFHDVDTGVFGPGNYTYTIAATNDSASGSLSIQAGGAGDNTPEAAADVNESASSVSPTTTGINDSQTYTVTVRIDTTSLADDTGEVDVRFENFEFDRTGDGTDLTIAYTAADVTDGTLTVSESVTATAPATAGTRDVNVTDLRRETSGGGTEFLIEDANVTIGTLGVTAPEPSDGAVGGENTTLSGDHPGSQQADIDSSNLSGDGSPSNPYEVATVSELQAMEENLSANYELVSDIDASQTAQFNTGSGFDPIGGEASVSFTPSPFDGSLDGNNHTITGLTVNRSDEAQVGLFGVTGSDAVIKNITLTEVTVSGQNSVGGLVGRNNGEIRDATVSGSVVGSNSFPGSERIGGLVGDNEGTLHRATASVTVDAVRQDASRVGGLVGRNGGVITNTTASGGVNGDFRAGGLVGQNAGVVRDSFAVGSVTDLAAESGGSTVTGLVGANFGTVEDAYFDTQTTGQSISAGNATGLNTVQMTGEAARSNMSGLAYGVVWTTQSADYPVLIDDPTGLTAVDTEYRTAENTTLTVTSPGLLSNVTDSGTGSLRSTAITRPTNGSVTLNRNGSFSYTPAPGFIGIDSFTYRVSDGTRSDTGTVTIVVTGMNSPPIAAADNYTTTEGATRTVSTSVGVLSNDVDPDTDTLTAGLVAGPTNGSLTLNESGSFSYTPRSGFTGMDAFIYTASDGRLNSTATVTINVTDSNNTGPVVSSATVVDSDGDSSVRDGDIVVVSANVSDPDGSAIASVTVDASGLGAGTVSLSETAVEGAYRGTLTVNASRTSNGRVFPEVTATDSAGNTNITRPTTGLIIDTTPPAAAIRANQTTVRPGEAVEFNVSGSSDSGPSGLGEYQLTANGSPVGTGVVGADSTVTNRFESAGTYTVTASVSDVAGNTDTDTVNITVTAASDPSATVNQSVSSVSPASITVNEQVRFDVTVSVDSPSVGDDAGEIDLRFEGFDLNATGGGADLTIEYTPDDVTGGTLRISESVTATAPATAGTRDVNLTDFRRETGGNGTEFLIEDANVTIDTVDVTEAPEGGEPAVISAPITDNETSFTDTRFIEQISFNTETGLEGRVNVTEQDTPNGSIVETIRTEFVSGRHNVTGFTPKAAIDIRRAPALGERETATLSGSIPASDIEDPSSLVILRVPDDQSSAERLPITVIDTAGETIDFEATTSKFSTFVVGETASSARAPVTSGNWSMPNGDAGKTSYNPESDDPRNITRDWEINDTAVVRPDVISQPVIVNNTVYVVGSSGNVTAVDAATGSVVWTERMFADGGNDAYLAVHNGTGYAANRSEVAAFDPRDGSVDWRYDDLAEGYVTDVTVADGMVLFGTRNPGVAYALAADDGTQLWDYTSPTRVSGIAVKNGTAFVSGENIDDSNGVGAWIAGVTADSGTVRWRNEIPATPAVDYRSKEQPVVSGGNVHLPVRKTDDNDGIVTDTYGYVYVYDTDGGLTWAANYTSPAGHTPTIAVADGVVYANTNGESRLSALDTASQSVSWNTVEFDTGAPKGNRATPIVANNTVYVGDSKGGIRAFDVDSGSQEFTEYTGWNGPTKLSIVNGTLYVVDGRGDLQAWSAPTPDGTDDPKSGGFLVDINGSATADTVTQGANATVVVSVTNPNERTITQPVILDFGGNTSTDSAELTLNGSESATVTLTHEVTVNAIPALTNATVRTGTNDDSTEVAITAAAGGPDDGVDPGDGAPPEGVAIDIVPGRGSSSVGQDGSRIYAETIVIAASPSDGVTIGDANSRAFRIVQTDTDTNESVVIEPESSIGTYNVTDVSFEIYRSNGTIGDTAPNNTVGDRGPTLAVSLANGSTAEVPVTVTGNRDLFDPSRSGSSVFDPYAVQLLDENTTHPSTSSVLAETESRIRGIGYDGGPGTEGGLRQNSTEGTIEVSIDRDDDIDPSWDIEYVVVSPAGQVILNRSVENTETVGNVTATFSSNELSAGTYTHAFTVRPTEGADRQFLTLVNDNLKIGGTGEGPVGGEPIRAPEISIAHNSGSATTSTQSADGRAYAEQLDIFVNAAVPVAFGGQGTLRLRVVDPDTGDAVTYTPTSNATTVPLDDMYRLGIQNDGTGEPREEISLFTQPGSDRPSEKINATVEGDTGIYTDETFNGYVIQLVDDTGDVLARTDERRVGMGYNAAISQNATTATLTRDPAVEENWTVEFQVVGTDPDTPPSEQVLDRLTLNHSDSDDAFEVPLTELQVGSGTYAWSLVIVNNSRAERDRGRIIRLFGSPQSNRGITVAGPPAREHLNLTANTTSLARGESVRFTVTDSSGSPVDATVRVPGGDAALRTGADGTVTTRLHRVGQLEAIALKTAAEDGADNRSDLRVAPGFVQLDVQPPSVAVDTSEVDFGDVPLGEIATERVNVRNNASVPVEVTPFIAGQQASAFRIEDAPDEIPAGGEASVTVKFAGTDPVTANAELVIGGTRIPLTGTGATPDIEFRTDIPVEIISGGSAQNATITVTNTGNADLNARLRSRSPAAVPFDHPDTLNISSGSTETFDVRFNADEIESREAFVEILVDPGSDARQPRVLPVVGVVKESEINIRRGQVTFGSADGSVVVNQSEERAVVVENTGSTTETLTASTDSQSFAVVETPSSFTLAPGEAQRVIVAVNASTTGAVSGTLTVEGTPVTSVNETAELSASVTEPELAITESVEFGETPANSGATEELQLSNSGSAPLQASLAVGDTNFTVVGETDVVVAPGKTETLRVGFTPATVGATSTTLSVDTNDPDATDADETVTLSGTGVAADVSTNRTTVTFGSVGLADSTTETLALTNDGSDVRVTDVTVRGAAGFNEQSDVEGQVVRNGETVEIAVAFTPEATGTRTGSLSLTAETTAGNQTQTRTFATNLLGTGRDSDLRIAQQRLRTGVTVADGTTTGRIGITNVGPAGTELTIDSVRVIDNKHFAVANTGSSVSAGDIVSSNETGQIAVRFAPEGDAPDGEQTARLAVNASGGERTFNRTIPVSGIVSAPAPTISTTSIDAGTVAVGESVRETVTLSNNGGQPYTVSVETDTARVVGPTEVVPGGETTIAIAVTPQAPGQFDETITINRTAASASPEAAIVTVSGEAVAPQLAVEPTTVSFSDTATGSASSRDVRLRNTGNATLEIASPELTGAASISLVSGDRPVRIAPGSSKNISLGFEPDRDGPVTATLTLDPRGPTTSLQTIDIDGTGITADANLNDSTAGFGELGVNETRTQRVELSNNGSAPFVITGVSITGSEPDAFSVAGLSRSELGAGESTTFAVSVNTTDVNRGDLTAEVAISTNESTVTAFAGATVTEPDIGVQRAVQADAFGTTRLGTTSTTTIQVNNTGTDVLEVETLTVAGADPAGFTVVETPENNTIPAADSGEIVIRFDPAAVSNATNRAQGTPLSASGELLIESTDPDTGDGIVTVDLNAEGETPAFDVQRTLQFGNTPVGDATTTTVTVENTASGTASLNVTAIEVSGPDADQYTASLVGSAAPVSLSPGESTTVQVGLEPASFGQKFATLSVQTNDTRQPVTKVGLSNTETTFEVNYGSVNVTYINPSGGPEPTVNVDNGLQDRNATLRTVNSDVNTTDNYALNYTFASPSEIKTNALDPSTGTALRYVEATTTAAAELNESTIRMTVSKAALAAQETAPANVTIYHDKNNNGNYESLRTELLFETPQGYVYEATTESYSTLVIAGDASDLNDGTDGSDGADGSNGNDGSDGTNGSDGTGDEGGNAPSDDSGGGGGGGLPSPGSTSLPDDVETLEQIDADIRIDGETSVAEIESGSAVERITFDRAGPLGELEVREYDGTPAEVGEPPVDATATVEILVPVEYEDEPAQIEFDLTEVEGLSVDSNSVEPGSITVWRHDGGEWRALDTEIETGQDGPIVLADTPGFSVFVISIDATTTEGPADTPDETTGAEASNESSEDRSEETAADDSSQEVTANDKSTDTGRGEASAATDAGTEEEIPGFGPIVTLIALLVAALIARRYG